MRTLSKNIKRSYIAKLKAAKTDPNCNNYGKMFITKHMELSLCEMNIRLLLASWYLKKI